MSAIALSFVIPLYKSAETIAAVVRDIESLEIDGGHEIVLVNDGSADRTSDVVREVMRDARVPITLVEHARNFGEHNAVLTGWRHAKGAHIVSLDDDGQNPPAEAKRLWEEARRTGLDVIFGHYEMKQHSVWRNVGSWFTNRMTDWALDKPPGFYLSSFRCVSAFVAQQVVTYAGPYPYIDGLILQVTQRIGSIHVRHEPRRAGQSTYTLRRLIRLWMAAWVNFSVLPLRLATFLGLTMAGGRTRRPRGRGGPVAAKRRAELRLRMDHGGASGVLRDAARAARSHRRVHRPHLPHGEPAPAVRRPRSRDVVSKLAFQPPTSDLRSSTAEG